MFTEDDLIFSYTRQQAIEDGVLIDVSDMAREAGFKIPVAVTQKLWADYIMQDDNFGQDEKGRLWDVLFLAACEIRARKNTSGSELLFRVNFRMRERTELVTLKIILGPGDRGEPVMTIMLPDED